MKKIILLFIFMGFTAGISAEELLPRSKKPLERKLQTIIVDHIEFEGATIDAVIKHMRKRAKQLDPEKKGVNIMLMLANGKSPANHKVTLDLDDLPLKNALDYISRSANLKFFITKHAVVIASKEIAGDQMVTRMFNVRHPPSYFGLKTKKDKKDDDDEFGSMLRDNEIFDEDD